LIEKGRALVVGSNVHILENETYEIAGWRFFGATLWSDFHVVGDMSEASHAAGGVMTDYKKIRHWPSLKKFSPLFTRQAHANSLLALRAFMASGDSSRSVVITHHAPSARSLPEKLRTDPVSGAYASNLETLIGETNPRLWIHGHIHQPSLYMLENTQGIANPRGYPGEVGFNKNFVLEVEPRALNKPRGT
jgi:hypothetical protein